MKQGLLYSQVGYDIGDPMKAYFRRTETGTNPNLTYHLYNSEHTITGKPEFYGEKWGSDWWIINFPEIKDECELTLDIYEDDVMIDKSLPIHVGFNLLWEKCIKTLSIDLFEKRNELARNQNGWKDCGSNYREITSITPPIVSLADLFLTANEDFSLQDQERICKQITVGADYVCSCMDFAKMIGRKEGSIVHDLPKMMICTPADLSNSVIALAKASLSVYENYPEKSEKYLKYAIKSYEYILNELEPLGDNGFNRALHDYYGEIPKEFATRDLLLFMSAGISLYNMGQNQYKDSILAYAKEIELRQIPKEESQDGIYGHFYTFKSVKVSEKNWTHHLSAHDVGGILPQYILPFCELCGMFKEDDERQNWMNLIESFTLNYFIPACQKNPFNLLPLGYYNNQGWLNFCGPWHGFNATIGYTAKLALELDKIIPHPYLREIAVSNIQWLCGINTGFTDDCFDSCLFWKPELPADKVVCLSQIVGIGNKTVYCWSDIKGSIPNGFCVNPQFKFEIASTKENDKPIRYTDEDWIPHSASLISALNKISIEHYFETNHPRIKKLLKTMN